MTGTGTITISGSEQSGSIAATHATGSAAISGGEQGNPSTATDFTGHWCIFGKIGTTRGHEPRTAAKAQRQPEETADNPLARAQLGRAARGLSPLRACAI